MCLIVLGLTAQPWVRSRCPVRERIALRMVEVNEAVVLSTLAGASWLGWGGVVPVLAVVLAVAPPLIGLGGLWALRAVTAQAIAPSRR